MITREQYLLLLELIDNYHRQNKTKTPIYEAIKGKLLTARLINCLLDNFDFIEDVNLKSLKSCRNIGKKSIEEFFAVFPENLLY